MPLVMTGIRSLVNMFSGNTSSSSIGIRRENVLSAVLPHLDSANKNVRLSAVTLLFNYTV